MTALLSTSAPERAARPLPAQLKARLLVQFPPRPLAEAWPEALCSRPEVRELVGSHGFDASHYDIRRGGLELLLDWLEGQPGNTWQERWLASGADAGGRDWAAGPAQWLEHHGLAGARLRYLTAALEALLGTGVLRPSISWLLTGGKGRRLGFETVRARDCDGFARLHLACEADAALAPADEDPARWGPWVAPCPIRQHELSRRKFVRQRKARMDARTRERLPLLPQLARCTDQWRRDAAAILAAGQAVSPGEAFSAAGQSLVRSTRLRPRIEGNVWARDQASGKAKLLDREEEHAFWAWAVIEVLRFTGLRVEELIELSHYSLVKYRLPTTGEVVPLLQIAPSKTDSERLLVVSPELAQVLSEVIRRVRGPDGAVRMVRAWDYHERVWLPPSPLLFQHKVGPEHKEFNIPFVSTLINDAVARTGSVGADGKAVHFAPHDFRRMFITDAVMNGLPPPIAQVIAGHHDLNVTMGYKAVYPDEALQAHLAFLARRRTLRPSDEYRSPTEEEWQAFFGHFERRKVSVGTCGRAFGTACIHEHACVRCALLWPDPSQRGRLIDIRDNIVARILRSQARGVVRRSRGAESQPGRRRRQTRPTRA